MGEGAFWMLKTIIELCDLIGVSGDERPVRDYIYKKVEPYAEKVTADVLGNLIVYKKGKKTPGKSIMVCAHMDEVGFIVTGVTDEGCLRFANVGGIDTRSILGKTVRTGGDIFGVIGCKAVHLTKKEERDKIPPIDDLYIDIGAGDKKSAEERVSPGDYFTFDGAAEPFGDGLILGKALDDRIGCACLIELIRSEIEYDCVFVFSAQEEVGNRGIFGASFEIVPDVALIVETTTAADLPDVKGTKKVCTLRGGVVIPFMDKGTIYDREFYTMLTGLADESGIPWQTKTYISGGTDASAIQRSRAGVKVAGLAAAVRNIHTGASVAAVSDIDALLNLSRLFIGAIGDADEA
jgi:putative aminopeptidase FrvX